MKKILVPTDFSQPAHNAASYAINLAKGIKANVELCHAMMVPAEAPMAAQVAWPLENYASIKKQATYELKFLANKLAGEEKILEGDNESPEITYSSEVGSVGEIVKDMVDSQSINLVVMGMAGASHLTRFLLGSNSLDIINKASFPVLLIPKNAAFNGIKKIAFATDLSIQDIEVIHSLAGLARQFNAEILITHVATEKADQQKIDAFLSEVTCKINYHRIYYRDIKDKSINTGLSWLTQHAQIDMLVMVHRQHNFFYSLFKSSHTQQLARHIHIPLLVYPEDGPAVRYFW